MRTQHIFNGLQATMQGLSHVFEDGVAGDQGCGTDHGNDSDQGYNGFIAYQGFMTS